jgi:arabinofuranan 3-O-arabinosyltransferase
MEPSVSRSLAPLSRGRTAARGQSDLAAVREQATPRLLGIWAPWRLQAYGYTLAAIYAALFVLFYRGGTWLVDRGGAPIPNDFTVFLSEARQALAGNLVSGYPPLFYLMLVPFTLMPYLIAFIAFQSTTLLVFAGVVYLIVRQPAAIALLLASPFGALDIRWGQTGFIRAALLGAALIALDRRPVLAGVFFGCLTYKPQFGILIPIALIAARQWRTLASATITAIVLASVSLAAFGIGAWLALPGTLFFWADAVLHHGAVNGVAIPWAALQTVYGIVRTCYGTTAVAWLIQGCVSAGTAALVWLVWRSSARYVLKAALLSAATLIATPYAWGYDLTVIAIPIAFLAKDQIERGVLRGEQTMLLALFGMALAILVRGGGPPFGPFIVMALIGLVLRRYYSDGAETGLAVLA